MIVGLLFSTIRPAYIHLIDNAKTDNVVSEIKEIEFEIDQFYKDNGRYPDSLFDIFDAVPLDPWGNPYQYLNINDAQDEFLLVTIV